MPSTYSNLKIQLMATGENNSTWGTVTNTNLGTALEEAITGSVDVTFASGDVTLTLTNTNATQSARNLRLNCTGTTGGARNLILGSGCQIEKVYIVNNGCADAITIKNTTGSGIAVPAGRTMYVFNTGSNVVDAINYLSTLTLGSALPIASGGTGSNTATFSGENITNLNASNISTGTIANSRTTAASANGASTIVARDASGNFEANTVTANLTGTASNATVLQTARTIAIQDGVTGTATSFNGSTNISIPVTAINASVINTGTIANARTTASSSNGASTIVARDASGNFSANTITATLSGNATNVSGTVAIANGGTGATDSGTARTNLGLGSMATQNSSSVSISGGSITGITDLAVADGGTGASDSGTARTNLDVPSRSGSGASGTWGINISGNAATASSATNATNATNATTSTTQSNGNNTTAIATTAYVQNMAIGWNQSWQDVTSSRAIGTTYTNSTGKPIMVVVWGSTVGPSANFTLTVGGVVASYTQGDSTNGGATSPVSAIVPNGSTYVVTGNRILTGWSELR